jgi:hypothetical protein
MGLEITRALASEFLGSYSRWFVWRINQTHCLWPVTPITAWLKANICQLHLQQKHRRCLQTRGRLLSAVVASAPDRQTYRQGCTELICIGCYSVSHMWMRVLCITFVYFFVSFVSCYELSREHTTTDTQYPCWCSVWRPLLLKPICEYCCIIFWCSSHLHSQSVLFIFSPFGATAPIWALAYLRETLHFTSGL